MKKPLMKGDYVLATNYHDGDPCDPFCVGYFDRAYGDRFVVVDGHGRSFRANGFRRCQRISRRVGDVLVRAMPLIGDRPGHSMWHWRRNIKTLEKLLVL